jgi:GT2 family glycosyltransferase
VSVAALMGAVPINKLMSSQSHVPVGASRQEGEGPARSSVRSIGVVIIGRNEGQRLVACLRSVVGKVGAVVYVDSGSSDGSAGRAETMGAYVVPLSMDKPFTAGRARNAGFARLAQLVADIRFVQFVDGDCIVADDWLVFAAEFLSRNGDVAIVCGRRKELHPDASIYNRLCDFEWDTRVGDTDASGGDFLARADAFRAVGGFDEALIAGEEPELCYRLRRGGWRIHRADHSMTYHDAAITHLSQWVKRASRAGYAYAASSATHFGAGDWYCVKENIRIVLWALAFPAAALLLSATLSAWFFLLLLVYPLQLVRLLWNFHPARRTRGWRRYCLFLLLGKWPEFGGQMLFVARSLRGRQETIIEYK